MDTLGYEVPAGAKWTREDFINNILKLQLVDGVNGNELGGWALTDTASDPDITGMAIQALAPYYFDDTKYTYRHNKLDSEKDVTYTVREVVDQALDKLGAIQRADGDYASWGTVNCESTAQVLTALTALGIDPAKDTRFIKGDKTLLDGILKYRLSGGGFSHSFQKDSQNPSAEPGQYNYMANDQAAYALVSYWRYLNGLRALYDMRGELTDSEKATIQAAITTINNIPVPTASNYKAVLKSALTVFELVPAENRRYVSNYGALARGINLAGGREALDSGEPFAVSLAITTLPAKTVYLEDETFDPAGMVVTATYSDGSTAPVSDYTLVPGGQLAVSVTEIIVKWGVFTATQPITVNERSPWAGSGTQDAPYLIATLEDLRALRQWTDEKNKPTAGLYFKMTADIDMTGVSSWSAIGGSRVFAGSFDGDGHVLKNYNITGFTAVFGDVAGVIRNFGVASGTVTDNNNSDDKGVIVNTLQSGGKVLNCWNGADVYFQGGYSGVIVGAVRGHSATIEGCYNTGSVTSQRDIIGGILGYCNDNGQNVQVNITNCYNAGDMTVKGDMGGIVGKNQGNLTITNCYNVGLLTCTNTNTGAKAAVGGIVGGTYGTLTLTNCYVLKDRSVAQMPEAVEIKDGLKGDAVKTAEEMKSAAFLEALGSAYKADNTYTAVNDGYPVLAWQTLPADTVTPPPTPPTPPTPKDPVKAHREKALAQLKAQFKKYRESDYSAENWAALKAAYEAGVAAIKAAEPAAAPYEENNIIAALNAALAAMGAIEPSRVSQITVAVSMDANTLGLGYLIEPTLVEVDNYTPASVVLTDLLRANGYSWSNTGTIESGFYLSAVRPVDQSKVQIAQFILDAVAKDGGSIMENDRKDTELGEFDYYNSSGWMYSVNGSFPGVGASEWAMADGEVMRWQFTVYGLGADLNADNSSWGAGSIVNVGNKDALTMAVARLRSQYSDDVLKANSVYTEAMNVLTDPTAKQTGIDAIAAKLAKERFKDDGTQTGSNTGTGAGTGTPPADDTPATTPVSELYTDMPAGSWYTQAVQFVVDRGLFQGTGDGLFQPQMPMSRAMLATVLFRLEDAAAQGTNPFADVAAGTWYTDAVVWANQEGIITGTGDGFEPDRAITRQEMVVMLYRYARTIGLEAPADRDLSGYTDAGQVADWARDAMAWAVGVELIRGTTDTTLSPLADASRAEVAILMERLIGMMTK